VVFEWKDDIKVVRTLEHDRVSGVLGVLHLPEVDQLEDFVGRGRPAE
jgi:hypothetical protein